MSEQATNPKTRTFTAPSGKEVEIKNFLNVREFNTVKKTLYGGVKIEGEAGSADVQQNISGAVLVEVEEKLVEVAVVRYGENTANPAEEIMNAETADDYTAIVKELEPLTKNLFTKAK
jgi:hypothetical protein